MTGPKRELPPLVVRIISDTKDALKGMQDIAKAARRMAKDVEKALSGIDKLNKAFKDKGDKDDAKRRKRKNKDEVKDAKDVAKAKEEIHANHLAKLARMDAAYLAQRRRNELAAMKRGLSIPKNALGPVDNRPRFWRRPRIEDGRRGLIVPGRGGRRGPAGFLGDKTIIDSTARVVESLPSKVNTPPRLTFNDVVGNALRDIGNTIRFNQSSFKDRLKSDFPRIMKEVSASQKSRKERIRRLKKIDKAYRDAVRDEDKVLKAKTLSENTREAQRFLNLGAGQGKNAFRLTSFGAQIRKSVLASNKATRTSAGSLDEFVASAQLRLKQKAVERQAMFKADQERARQVEQSRKAIKSQSDSVAKEIKSGIDTEVQIQRKAAEERARQVEQSRKAIRQQTEALNSEEERTTRRMRIRRRDRLRQERKDAEDAARQRDLHMRRQTTKAKRLLGGIFGGGMGANMMGARADMFMHSGTIQNMAQSAVGFLTPFAQVENATVQMRAYAGSAEAAQKVIEDMQRFAIQSPYKLEGVLEAASNLMKYGQSAQEAMEITRMLGDVAGGNTAKLELLALATAQASGFGRLQGQELRQLVNAGFNPLKTAARELAGGKGIATDKEIEKQMDFLLTAMRKRQLDSDIIKAALQVETSKGGDFAGITQEQARSLTGWANQFLETLDLIKIQITETFVDDLKKGLETVVRYTEATVQWMRSNKELVKQYTMLGLKLLKYALAFSVLGFAMATLKWVMGSLMMMLAPFELALDTIKTAIKLFGNEAVIAWLKLFGPIGLGIAAVAALGVAIASFRNKNGFLGFVMDSVVALTYFVGFLYNFSHNLENVFNYFGANFKRIIFNTVMTPLFDVIDLLTMIANFFSSFFGVNIPSFTGKLREIGLRNIGAGEHDTSMFKFDGPGLGDSKMLKDMQAKVMKELAPYLPKTYEERIKDKPDINFKSFIKGAEGGGVGQMREHAVSGSAEHALRMYQFGQASMANFEAQKKSSEKKQEELLAKIEKNTRQKAIGSGDLTIEDANLVLTAPGRID